eukprot:gene2391-8699_t
MPLADLAMVRWVMRLPRAAAAVIGESQNQGGSGALGGLEASQEGPNLGSEVNHELPLVWLYLSPVQLYEHMSHENFPGLRALIQQASKHYPDCTLKILTSGLDSYLLKRERSEAGFNKTGFNKTVIYDRLTDFIIAPDCKAAKLPFLDRLTDFIIAPDCKAAKLRYDLKDDAHISDYLIYETRAMSQSMQRAYTGGFYSIYVRSADMFKYLGNDKGYEECQRTFAKALIQNGLLSKEKAASIAAKWLSIPNLLRQYDDPTKTEKQKQQLLMGPMVTGSGNLGLTASKNVYELFKNRDPDALVYGDEGTGGS